MFEELWTAVRDWFVPPRWQTGPIYRDQAAWVAKFEVDKARHGPLALEQARINYDETARHFEALDAKSAELLRTAGTLASVIVVAVANFHLAAGFGVKMALICLLFSMGLSMLCRRAVLRPAAPSVRQLMEPLADPREAVEGQFPEIPQPHAWLAASIEGASIAHRDLEEWKARHIFAATVLIVAAMIFLLSSVIGL